MSFYASKSKFRIDIFLASLGSLCFSLFSRTPACSHSYQSRREYSAQPSVKKSEQQCNSQFAQQRLDTGAVIAGWVSSFYLLLPAGVTPFLGIYIDGFGQRVTLRRHSKFLVTHND